MTDGRTLAETVRIGCNAADVHLTCSYPECSCKQMPATIKAVITEKDRRIAELEMALEAASLVAEEARAEWDAAPSGMRAGKILIALSGRLPGYRADIDSIHAIRRARSLTATAGEEG